VSGAVPTGLGRLLGNLPTPFGAERICASLTTALAKPLRSLALTVVRREQARQLIDGAAFGPEALKVVGEAFDKAWAQISANYGSDPTDIEKGRLCLAQRRCYQSPRGGLNFRF
jgi:hypothetical protein